MKKISFFLVAFVFSLFFGNGLNVSANEVSSGEVNALNLEISNLVEEANIKLGQGVENFEVSSGDLTLFFESKENKVSPFLKDNLVSTASTVGSKSYQVYVANTAGFNFRHGVSGTFSWNSLGQLTGVTAVPDLSGVTYEKSDVTNVTGVDGIIGRDAKIARIYSKGTFIAFKYLPKSYYTTLIVDVYGPTKEYRIIEAKIAS